MKIRHWGYGVFFAALLASCGDQIGTSSPQAVIDSSLPLNFALTPEEIRSRCSREQEGLKGQLAEVGRVETSRASFQNTILALEIALAEFNNKATPLSFLKYVSDKPEVRAAADECETAISQMYVDIFVREDIYNVLKNYAAKNETRSAEDQKLLKDTIVGFQRNGLDLAPEIRKVFIEKKKALVTLEAEFSTAVNEYQDELLVTKEELNGMPDSYIQGLKQKEGKYAITLAYPDYFPFMEGAKNADARRRLEYKFNQRGGKPNVERLEKAITLRHELATLLGFANHAEFVLFRQMAKKPENVRSFLADLVTKLQPKGKENIAELLELKRAELNNPEIQSVDAWDWRYYDAQLKKNKHQIDSQKIREYFPLQTVLNGMFDIYQTLLGVTFVPAPEIPTWHADVRPYRIVQNNQTMAYFYMDLFPRPGKYGHAAAFTILSAYVQPNGSYRAPVSSIVANFNPPLPGAPSLLAHSEVETLFHEFGHIMHQTLTKARYASFSGTSVMRDFVEAPSQMLEAWVWETAPLNKLSGHYLNPSEKLPAELIEKMIKAKLVDVGIFYLRQASFATLDMNYHTQASVDSTKVYADAMRDIMMMPIQEGTYPQASFGHLMGGYDAGYYGYLWSEVYAADMYTRFAKEGLLNTSTGLDYRKWILEPGGTQDAFELISGFLGRAPNQEAFLKSLGL